MGWKVLIDTVEYLEAVVETIEEILNGHIEATFTLPNTAENRTIVNSDHVVEIFYNDTSEFKGILRAPEFQRDKLLCKCYQTAEEQGQRKVHIGNYPSFSPDVIFAAICASAGIVAGVCPVTPALSVRYDRAYCYDAARYIAWVLGKDLYSDFSGTNPRYNIGTAGTGYPSGRGVLQYTVTPRRGKDRGKKRDKVYLRGLDAAGNPLVGSAGSGTDVSVGTDRTSTDQATIDAMAAKKLAELNTESSGCMVTVALESPDATPAYVQGYDIHAGDYVIFDCTELDYSAAVVRVAKVTKQLVDIIVEVEKAEKLLDDYLEEYAQWEELGIYAAAAGPDIDPVTPTGFGTDDIVVATVQNADGTFVTCFAVTVHNVADMTGYKVRWQKQGTSVWNYVEVGQPIAGDAVLNTGPVAMGSVYDLQVASFNKDGKISDYTTSIAKTATTDTTAPSVPSGVTATTSQLVRAIKVYWTTVTSVDLKGYKVYRHTSNLPGSATEIARTSANFAIIETNLTTPYYFWVSSFDFIGNESAKSTLATGCPITGQKEIVTDLTDVAPAVPTIAFNAQEIDTAAEFRTWLHITITRVTDAGGYAVGYKRSADSEWKRIYVEQLTTGNPIVTTPDLEANTSYDVHACSISKLGLASAWCTTQTLSTLTNNTAPAVPTGLAIIAVVDGVLLEWTAGVATDLSYYKVYHGTSSPPTVVAGQSNRQYYLWKKEPADTYVLYYFAITAVDSAGNESAKCTAVSATPTHVKPIDLSIESQPWTATFKVWEDETTYGKLYWSASDGASDIIVKFADLSTKTVTKNLTGTSYAAGLRYFYWDTSSTLQNTTDFWVAVGEGKGLIAVVDVRTDRRSTVLPFNSYMPTIGSGAIAAKTILTEHIQASQITTSLVTSVAALAIKASQIVLDGSTYFMSSWQKSGDVTKIDGGYISTGTVDALQIKADAITAIKIKAGEVHTSHILFDILAADPTYAAGKLWWIKTGVRDELRFSSGTTLGDVAIIPKYPLSQDTAPPENLIPNQCFELDRDVDNTPDYWYRETLSGNPIYGFSSTPPYLYKGKQTYYIAFTGGGTGEGKLRSEYIPVTPGRKYLLRVAYYGSGGYTHTFSVAHMEWYDQNKANKTESDPSADWKVTTISWQVKEYEFTVPSGKYYARVALRNLATAGVSEAIYYSDIVFSEQRAAIATAGTVGGTTLYSYQLKDIAGSWETLETITPAVDTEEFIVTLCISIRELETVPATSHKRFFRVYDVTTGIYYPINTSDYGQMATIVPQSTFKQSTFFMATIPSNVNGHTLRVQFGHDIGQYTEFYYYITAWGHSPHTHR